MKRMAAGGAVGVLVLIVSGIGTIIGCERDAAGAAADGRAGPGADARAAFGDTVRDAVLCCGGCGEAVGDHDRLSADRIPAGEVAAADGG